MPDLRESFPSLEDVATGAGIPLHKVLEGDAAAGKNASAALVGKDPSGNLIYLTTNSDGELVTSGMAGDTANIADTGSNGGSGSFVTLLTLLLTTNKEYKNLSWSVSGFRDTIFEIVQIDDAGGTPVETIHATLRVGPGDFTDSNFMENFKFTAGPTGVINLILRAKNQNANSTMDGTLSIDEIQ